MSCSKKFKKVSHLRLLDRYVLYLKTTENFSRKINFKKKILQKN